MIVDCHVHISKYDHEGQEFTQVRDDLLTSMTKLGITRALVYPDSEPNTDVSDLEATRDLVAGQPSLRMLGTVRVPDDATQPIDITTIATLDALASTGEIGGVKLYPGFELFYPDDRRCYPLYELCIAHDMPIVYHSGETMDETWREEYNHPHEIAQVAKRFPALKIVIAHFSQPHLKACRDVILRYRNVHADISGLAHPDVIALCGKELIRLNLEAVATRQPGKVLFGTDWPMCDVEAHLHLMTSLPIVDGHMESILSRNAERVFSI